jgi:hypothetical protein
MVRASEDFAGMKLVYHSAGGELKPLAAARPGWRDASMPISNAASHGPVIAPIALVLRMSLC